MMWKQLLYLLLISTFVNEASSQCDGHEENKCENNKTHHCQFDIKAGITIQFCANPMLCSPGSHAVLDGDTKSVFCEECAEDIFQPKVKLSNDFTQSKCDYRVTPCNEQQLICENATTTQNNKCACNHTAGYKPRHISNCTCFSQDSVCECVKADCKEGEILTEDFDCIQCFFDRNDNYETGSKTVGVAVGFAILLGGFILGCVVMYVCKRVRSRRQKNKDAVAVPVVRVTEIESVELQERDPDEYREYHD